MHGRKEAQQGERHNEEYLGVLKQFLLEAKDFGVNAVFLSCRGGLRRLVDSCSLRGSGGAVVILVS